MRDIKIADGEHYHIYNRGVDKRNIFSDQEDVDRFFQSMLEFNVVDPIGSMYEHLRKKEKGTISNKLKLVEIVAFSFVENHFHFILKQVSEKGVEKFMHRLGNGYTKYFNNKYERSGSLFQGKYKAKHIDSDNYLLHLSVYVNLNQRVHQFGHSVSKLQLYSSWGEYSREDKIKICDKDVVLTRFKSKKEYVNFAESSLKDILLRKSQLKEGDSLYME